MSRDNLHGSVTAVKNAGTLTAHECKYKVFLHFVNLLSIFIDIGTEIAQRVCAV